MGEFFQQVHVWVVKNCTLWYMDGPDLIYRGTWMGHFSFKIGTWMGDGWWHFKIPRGTPLPRPKLSTPPELTSEFYKQIASSAGNFYKCKFFKCNKTEKYPHTKLASLLLNNF